MAELNIKHTSSGIMLLKPLERYPKQLDDGSKMVQRIHCLEALVRCLAFFLSHFNHSYSRQCLFVDNPGHREGKDSSGTSKG
jgi:hypothetical protein